MTMMISSCAFQSTNGPVTFETEIHKHGCTTGACRVDVRASVHDITLWGYVCAFTLEIASLSV